MIKKTYMDGFNIDLDFCVIPNPFNDGSRYILFLTRRGLSYLDETLIKEVDYGNVVNLIESLGYIESEPLTFEFKNTSDIYHNFEIDKVIKTLEKNGIKYNKKLEGSIIEEFNSLKKQAEVSKEDILLEWNKKQEEVFKSTKEMSYPAVRKEKFVVPEVGEKLNLFFYLFLQCHFVGEERCVIDFNGDFFSKKNNFLRNYIMISSCDFTRIENNDKNVVVLQSDKTYADFYKEIDILFGGAFEYVKSLGQHSSANQILVTKKYVYNVLDIKRNINPKKKIVVEVEKTKYFNEMLTLSSKIKSEKEISDAKKYPIHTLIEELEELIDILKNKMTRYAETEEYEKSADLKKDILSINKKIKGLKKLKRKEITIAEYVEIFKIG